MFKNEEKEDRGITALIRHKVFAAFFLFLVSFGVFTPSLKNDFVWDDMKVMRQSFNYFKAPSVSSMLIPKIKKEKDKRYYRPVVFTSMLVDREVWGTSPFGFHLSNLVFHSVSTVLFYFTALLVLGEFRVRGKGGVALLSSLLFALHPMHVESVSWASGRTDVLCGLFFFLAFIFYILSYRNLGFLFLSAVCFFLSLLSKEVAIAFPILALGFDVISGRYKNRGNVLKYAVCGLLALIYLYLRGRAFVTIPEISSERVQGAISDGYPIWEVSKVLLNSYLFYIKELVFPFKFNAFIAAVPGGFYNLLFSIFVILSLCVIGFVSVRKRENITAFSILWVLVTLAPSSIISISWIASTPLAERYLYIPSAGYCLLVGYLILRAGERMKSHKVGWALGLLLCTSYLFFTVDRQSVWKSNLALWEDTSKRSPYRFITRINYGAALKDAGRGGEAIREFLTILEDPRVESTGSGKAMAASNIGTVYLDKRDHISAEKWFLKALDYKPDLGEPYYQLGFIYFVRGDSKGAEEQFLKALKYDPKNGKTYYHLGAIYFIKGEYEDSTPAYRRAEEYLKKAARLSPSIEKTHFLLAKVYLELGERKKARRHAKQALQNGLTGPLAKEAQDMLRHDR